MQSTFSESDGAPVNHAIRNGAAFGRIDVASRKIVAGGGAKLGHVISTAVREGLAGLEPLVGIPGTVGGALHTNAGTHGGDIGQTAAAATVMTRKGDIVTRQKSELRFGYRLSMILAGILTLERERIPKIKACFVGIGDGLRGRLDRALGRGEPVRPT